MLFEDIILLILLTSGVFLIGIPIFKFTKAILPKKRNFLTEAKKRLDQAKLDAEAARLNKETEQLYEKMYEETLQENIRQENYK